jgi:sec-independent protein translocase protein TatB
MFDFAWSELALIAVVALVVIGPKDLPRVMRTVGFWVGKARGIAREFQSSLDEMMREAELDSVKEHIDKATRFNFEQEMAKTIDPKGELEHSLSDPVLANPLIEAPKPAGETAAEEGTAVIAPPAEPARIEEAAPSSAEAEASLPPTEPQPSERTEAPAASSPASPSGGKA